MLEQAFFDKLDYLPTVEMLFDISDKPVGKLHFVNDIIGVEPNMCYEDEIYPVYEEHVQNIQKYIWELLIGKFKPYTYEVKAGDIAIFIADHSNKMNIVVANKLKHIHSSLDIFYSRTFPNNYFLILPVHGFSFHTEGTKFYQQEKYGRKALEVKMKYSFSIAQTKPYYVVKVVK